MENWLRIIGICTKISRGFTLSGISSSLGGRQIITPGSAYSTNLKNPIPFKSTKKKRKKEAFDTLGNWDTAEDLPLLVDASIASGKPIPSIGIGNVGVSSVKGRRSYMEDHYGIEQLHNDSMLYISVFDGHGSDACAKFCANVFPKHVSEFVLLSYLK